MLFVTRNFPPLVGGMETLAHRLFAAAAAEMPVVLIGPRGCRQFAAKASHVYECRIAPIPWFLLTAFFKGLRRQTGSSRSSVVLGGSGLVAPVVVLLAKMTGARSIILVHGLDLIVESVLYRYVALPFIRRADFVVANSANTQRIAQRCGVPGSRITVINPGADLPEEFLDAASAKQQLGLAQKRVLLSLGRLIPRKGLLPFLQKSFEGLARQDKNLVLLIAGDDAQQAVNRSTTSMSKQLADFIAESGLAEQVQLLGYVSPRRALTLYAAADVFVFPLIETRGDVEGFGMVAVEAAASGTPTVAFDCGGVADAIEDGTSGYLVPAGDYTDFSRSVRAALDTDLTTGCREYSKRFTWDRYWSRLRQVVNEAKS